MDRSSSSQGARVLGILLLLAGLVLVVIGAVYLSVAAGKLPSFMGRIPHATGHRTKRAIAGLGLGLIFWIGAGIAFARSRSAPR